MQEFEIKIKVRECTLTELPESDRLLVEAAQEATRTSYVPYSRFHVGAAILMADGEIVAGSNQGMPPILPARVPNAPRRIMPPPPIRAYP